MIACMITTYMIHRTHTELPRSNILTSDAVLQGTTCITGSHSCEENSEEQREQMQKKSNCTPAFRLSSHASLTSSRLY